MQQLFLDKYISKGALESSINIFVMDLEDSRCSIFFF